MRKTKAEKLIESRIQRIEKEAVSETNAVVDIMDLSKITQVARDAVAAGADDVQLKKAVVEFIEKIPIFMGLC